jgi:protein involved in polysaccharide export with SLBB domain
LGEANTPGPHLVSGLATVLNALYAAGGIKTSGTLRSIKVYRNNQLLKEIDLYDYITSGKLDNDIRLANNDIIFIAPRISNISLGGTVKSAAIYELKKNEGLNELIKFSGGLPANASLNNVNIQRITPFESRDQKRIYDKFLTSVNYLGFLKSKKNFILENGDSVFFSSILNKSINQVVIIGNVNKPGAYSLDKFNNLKDLIVYGAENIMPNTYLNKVDIFKEDLEGNKKFITYNLNTVLNGEVKVSLENDDSVRVYNIKDVAGEKTIKISGYGTEPKTIFWRENLNLFDLIFQSTSFEELEFQSKLLSSRVDIKRFNVNTGLFDILQGSLDNLISLKNITLLPKDEVVLYSKSVYEEVNKTIIVEGFIRTPGEYKLYNNMSVEDAVLIAGGFKEYADQDSVIVYREDFDAKNGRLSTRFILPIHTKYLKGESFKNSTEFYLKNNDLVSIRKKIGTQNIKKIKIAGEVNYPGIVTLEFEKNSLNSIISNAGGLKNTANLDASFVIRNNRSLSLDLNNEINSSNEIFQDGDSLFIAPNVGTVITLGAVENESQFIWQSNKKAKYYIRNSGGKINKVASSSYLIYPSGKAVIIGFFRNPRVFPNSKIIVNRKITNLNDNGSEKNWDKISKLLTLITSSLTAAVLASKL